MSREGHKFGTPVVWRDVSLVGKANRWIAPEGMSIQEIIQSVPSLPPYFMEAGIVCINGEPVPRRMWPYVRPKLNGKDVIITLHIQLESIFDDIIRVVEVVAVVVVAAVLGPIVAAEGFGLVAGTTAFLATSAAVTAAVTIGGGLLISALSPPPSKAAAAQDAPDKRTKDRTAGLTGNTIGAGDHLPRVLGFRRVFPTFVCSPIIELVGLTEVVEGVYGLAGPHRIDAVYADNNPLSTMPEVEYEINEGFPGSIQQTLVQRQGFVSATNTQLSEYLMDTTTGSKLRDQGSPQSDVPFYHRFSTRVAPDEFWLSLGWTEGFLRSDASPVIMAVRVRFRIAGTTNWTNCPEIHFASNLPDQYQQTVKLMWQKAPSTMLDPDPKYGAVYAYTTVPPQVPVSSFITGPTTTGYAADSYFYKGSGDTFWWSQNTSTSNTATTGIINTQLYRDRVEFYLDPAVFPPQVYEVEIVRGQTRHFNSWNVAPYTDGNAPLTSVVDLFGYFLDAGGTPIARLIDDISTVKDKITVIRATSIWNEPPVRQGAPIALIAVRATGRSIASLSCDAGGYTPIPLNGNFDTFAVSSNPADHYRDVLVGNLGAFPLQAVQTDDLTLWRNDCDANAYQINAVIQGQKQTDVLRLIAAAGYARPIQSETWGVAEDKDQSSNLPIQIFTPRNLMNFQWTRTFSPYADGFRVKYDNALNLYVEDEQVILDPESFTGGIRLEDIRYETITDLATATKRALFDLKAARRRLIFYGGTTDIENLLCRVGDLVGVSHDILSSEVGSARILTTTNDGMGNLTGLTLDDSVPENLLNFFNDPTLNFFNDPTLNFFNKNARMGVMIRTNVGTMLVKEVTGTAGDVTALTFVTPFADPGTIVKNCLLTFGPLGSEIRRLLVQNIKAKADFTADMTFVDEAQDLWGSKIVTILLHGDGANNSTTIPDSSSYANPVVVAGNAKLSTTWQEFGTASIHFNGTNSVVSIADVGTLFNPQTDFTIDFWFNPTSITAGTLCCKNSSGAGFPPWLLQLSGGNITFSAASIGNASFDIANAIVICPVTVGVPHHFAIVRMLGFFMFYLDGVRVFSFYTPLTLNKQANGVRLGNYNTSWYNGYIDEFRYTNGIGRWVNNFNPPVVAGIP